MRAARLSITGCCDEIPAWANLFVSDQMRISSASASVMEHPSEPDHGFDSPLVTVRPALKQFFRKLDRMFTAIAYAEAGNLDAVKEMLEQDKVLKKQ